MHQSCFFLLISFHLNISLFCTGLIHSLVDDQQKYVTDYKTKLKTTTSSSSNSKLTPKFRIYAEIKNSDTSRPEATDQEKPSKPRNGTHWTSPFSYTNTIGPSNSVAGNSASTSVAEKWTSIAENSVRTTPPPYRRRRLRHKQIRRQYQLSKNKYESQNLLNYYYGAKISATLLTPCTYPTPNEPDSWQKCALEPEIAQNYNICDPEAIMFFSKIDSLRIQLDAIEYRNGDHCACSYTTGPYCWYKFAFAFLNELKFPRIPLPHDIEPDELCHPNVTTYDRVGPSDTLPDSWGSRTAVWEYGNKFADLLRQRWRLGNCHEDILFLIVKNVPSPLKLGFRTDGTNSPAIFVSFGDLVKTRTDHLTRPHDFHIKSMQEAVNIANEMLQGNGENSTIDKSLLILLSWYEQMLNLADQTFLKYSPRAKQHNHIPPTWALAAFAGCAILLVVMAAGSCLVRTRARRSVLRSKQVAGDANRYWKAGFVGGMLMSHDYGRGNSLASGSVWGSIQRKASAAVD